MADLNQIQFWIDQHVNDPQARRTIFYIHNDQLEAVKVMLDQSGRPFCVAETPDPNHLRIAMN